jgi:cytochrome c5
LALAALFAPSQHIFVGFEKIMSTQHDAQHEEDHSGPVKTPKQFAQMAFFSFVVPIFMIIGLVYYVVSDAKPSGDLNDKSKTTFSGLSDADRARGVAARIQKVGTVEIKDANRALKTGEEVFKAQCTACHTAGVAGAPKFGDAAAWGARIATGYEALLTSALKGKGAMGAQGGGDFEDAEIGRAVVYMANAGGAKFAEPQKAVAAVPAAEIVAAPAAPAAPAAK